MESTHWLRFGHPALRGRQRAVVAALVELLPLIPVAVQFSPLTAGDDVTPLWGLALVTGLGWVIGGRWRAGLFIAAGRIGVLWAGMYALIITTFSGGCVLGDTSCTEGWQRSMAMPVLWGMAAFYVLTAVLSAWFSYRAAHRGQASSDLSELSRTE